MHDCFVVNIYLPQATTYVEEENGVVKEFVGILPNSFIGALFVDAKFQRQGVGAKLIDHYKTLYDTLSLAVYVENKSAVAFYLKNGFNIIAQHPNEDSGHLEYTMAWSGNESTSII